MDVKGRGSAIKAFGFGGGGIVEFVIVGGGG